MPDHFYSYIIRFMNFDIDLFKINISKWYWYKRNYKEAIMTLNDLFDSYKNYHVIADGKNSVIKYENFYKIRELMKSKLLNVNWKNEIGFSSHEELVSDYNKIIDEYPTYSKSYYYLGKYYLKMFEEYKLALEKDFDDRTLMLILLICENFIKCLRFEDKYFCEVLPRVVTLWFELGEREFYAGHSQLKNSQSILNTFAKLNDFVRLNVLELPPSYLYFIISQIVSRITHPNQKVYNVIESILSKTIHTFPEQCLWSLIFVSRSINKDRASKFNSILKNIRSKLDCTNHSKTKAIIDETIKLSRRLIEICNFSDKKNIESRTQTFTIKENFNKILSCLPCNLIVPIEKNLNIFSKSNKIKDFKSEFIPKIKAIKNEVKVIRSLQRPKKITFIGTDDIEYSFLCKPKDDLRKDSRMMELNSIINNILRYSFESRKRNLNIKTYSVIPMNEECGIVEWVENTKCFRTILQELYSEQKIDIITEKVRCLLKKKTASKKEVFVNKLLPLYPPVFYKWFYRNFVDSYEWFSTKTNYTRSISVMSIIGYVVGLGDRHGENILVDENFGNCMHVDFSCLFEKGLKLPKPEVVPFRLTQNVVNGFGITGVDGSFRICCEITLKILRENKDTVKNILETFLYDPLCEWGQSMKSLELKASTSSLIDPSIIEINNNINYQKTNVNGNTCLQRVYQKIIGDTIFSSLRKNSNLTMSVEGQVQELIKEATDPEKLFDMYIGWGAYL